LIFFIVWLPWGNGKYAKWWLGVIPPFNDGGVLPPFVGGDVTGVLNQPRSPYKSSALALVERFATSRERGIILRGLLNFRARLRAVGFVNGIQWIDGSFVEDVEISRQRPPGDVDVVTLIQRPSAIQNFAEWANFLQTNAAVFDPARAKADFFCDAYFIDLNLDGRDVAEQASYWFGLFSHQRDTFRWKGMVQLELMEDDAAADAALLAKEGAW
jgi:hypothetical protein